MTVKNKELQKKGLSVLVGHEPGSPFRFEPGVSLGRCEILAGVAFGMYSYMNSGFVRSAVVVGRYCSIGRNVTLGSGVHDHEALSTHPFFKINSNPPALRLADTTRRIRVLIGHDVWIGDNAYVMSGVTVGDGAILAAGSIVTKNVEPYSIVGGVPAKHLKWRFPEDRIARLKKLRWHEFSPERLREIDIGNWSSLETMEAWPDTARTEKSPCYTSV